MADLGLQEMMESLYNLDKEELRRLAWEALLISDGPDKRAQDDGRESHFTVVVVPPVGEAPGKWGFVIRGRRSWET
jgi:hypothetical protein